METGSYSEMLSLPDLLRQEWAIVNRLGGFAMGTAAGIATRRYHGHLVAAVHPPADRWVLLDSVDATIDSPTATYGISSNQYSGVIHPEGHRWIVDFTAQEQSVTWLLAGPDWKLRKTIAMPLGENRVDVTYTNEGDSIVDLALRPLVSHRPYHGNFSERPGYPARMEHDADSLFVTDRGVTLLLEHPGARRELVQGWYYRFERARETERGLKDRDDLFCPCELRYRLSPGEQAVLGATCPTSPSVELREPTVEDDYPLGRAARKFWIETPSRTSLLAGLPWFTDWGRDTMISLPGLCLRTGRVPMARQILRDYASQMRRGLIPNRFVEAHEEPEYNTVDASLWFAYAAYRTLDQEWDEKFAVEMLAALREIIEWHRRGTDYGIRLDDDGLITQGEAGVQLTWMDAKIGDWVVTPRYGKPIEVNGLWIQALRTAAWLCERLEETCDYVSSAELSEEAFEKKFWSEHHGWFFDTVDPYDAQLRPNQLIPFSLPLGPRCSGLAERALSACEEHLVTPRGVRTLAPFEAHYQGHFEGPLHELDAAYHQGTAWPWLLGIYAQACLNARGHFDTRIIETWVDQMLGEAGVDGIAEVYDGDEPQRAAACPWQAWSVATLMDALALAKESEG